MNNHEKKGKTNAGRIRRKRHKKEEEGQRRIGRGGEGVCR